jgi:hypothetical protein
MSHAILLALINNHSVINHSIVKESMIDFKEHAMNYIKNFMVKFYRKYTEFFGNNDYIVFSLVLLIVCALINIVEYQYYLERMRDAEDQIQYLKKKARIQEGNLEFLLDNNANNELKFAKLAKQMRKLQKEVNEYA